MHLLYLINMQHQSNDFNIKPKLRIYSGQWGRVYKQKKTWHAIIFNPKEDKADRGNLEIKEECLFSN